MARDIIAGQPGDEWTNDTGKILWQFRCNFSNTCGLCLQFHHQIGAHWPIPLHRKCNCTQTPVKPGATAAPFVDFMEVLNSLPTDQQKRVVGVGNLDLIETGKVKWEDVVTPGRIRTLSEVIAREGLSIKDLRSAGFSQARAANAFAGAHPEEVTEARRSARAIAEVLKAHGLTSEEIARKAAERLVGNVAADLIPGTRPRQRKPPRTPPMPPAAPAVPAAPSRPKPGLFERAKQVARQAIEALRMVTKRFAFHLGL